MAKTNLITRRTFGTAAFGTLLSCYGGSLALAGTDGGKGIELRVEHPLGNVKRAFSDAALSALPQVSFDTSTIWTEGVLRFSGPTLHDVLAAAGLGPDWSALRLHALNDYSVTMERSFLENKAPIVANRIGGEPFSIRQRGPFWLIFPYDSYARYRTEIVYSLSIWQLHRIEVR